MATYKSKGVLQEDAYRHLITEVIKGLENKGLILKSVRRKLMEKDYREIVHIARSKIRPNKSMEDIIESAVEEFLQDYFRKI